MAGSGSASGAGRDCKKRHNRATQAPMSNKHAAVVAIVLAPLALAVCMFAWAQQAHPANSSPEDPPPFNVPPTPLQIQALVSRAIENQHRDDLALNQYERKERIISQRGK